MRLLQAFTSDPARLASAVDFATTGDDARRAGPATSLQSLPETPAAPIDAFGEPTRPDAPPNPALAGIGGNVQRYLGELGDRVQAFDSLYGLLAIARSLEAVRGRKSILYFAEAREVSTSVTGVYDTTIGEANRANVTIHTVDTRGLRAQRPGGRSAFDEMIGSFSASGGTRAADTDGRVVIPKAGDATDVMADYGLTNPLQGSFLERIAHDTGGLAIADTNDLGLGLGPRRRGAGPVLRGRLRAAEPRPRRSLPPHRGEGLAPGRERADARGLLRDARRLARPPRLRDAAPGRARGEDAVARLRPPRERPALRREGPGARGPVPGAGAALRRAVRHGRGPRRLPSAPDAPGPREGRGRPPRRPDHPRLADRGAARREGPGASREHRLPPRDDPPGRPLHAGDGRPGPRDGRPQRGALGLRHRRGASRRPGPRQPVHRPAGGGRGRTRHRGPAPRGRCRHPPGARPAPAHAVDARDPPLPARLPLARGHGPRDPHRAAARRAAGGAGAPAPARPRARRPDRRDLRPAREAPGPRPIRDRGDRPPGRRVGRGADGVRGAGGDRGPGGRGRAPSGAGRSRARPGAGRPLRARLRAGLPRRRGRGELHAVGRAGGRDDEGPHAELHGHVVPPADSGRRRLRAPRGRDSVGHLPGRLRGGRPEGARPRGAAGEALRRVPPREQTRPASGRSSTRARATTSAP